MEEKGLIFKKPDQYDKAIFSFGIYLTERRSEKKEIFHKHNP